MSELRQDPIVGRWVIISTERGKRPSDFGRTESRIFRTSRKSPRARWILASSRHSFSNTLVAGSREYRPKRWMGIAVFLTGIGYAGAVVYIATNAVGVGIVVRIIWANIHVSANTTHYCISISFSDRNPSSSNACGGRSIQAGSAI